MKLEKYKRVLLDILLIDLSLGFLTYEVNKTNNISNILMAIILFITCFELMIKYIKEVHIPKSINKVIKVLFIIFLVLLIFLSIYTNIKNINVLDLTYIIGIIILLVYLLVIIIINTKNIIKEKNKIFNYTKNLFLYSFSFILILSNLIMMLLKN